MATKPCFSFVCLFCIVYFVTDTCLLLLCYNLVFQYSAKRLAGTNIPKTIYFASGGTSNLNSINQSLASCHIKQPDLALIFNIFLCYGVFHFVGADLILL